VGMAGIDAGVMLNVYQFRKEKNALATNSDF
jgi:hypothetical protein